MIDHFLRMTIQNNLRAQGPESRRREERLLRHRAEISAARRNRRRQRVHAAWDALR